MLNKTLIFSFTGKLCSYSVSS